MTLVELIVAFTILALLTSMAVPLARSRVRREREKELRIALREIHTAIDKYKDMADSGQLGQQNAAKEGYPETLEILVEGVKVTGQAGAGGGVAAVVNAHGKAIGLQINYPVFAAAAVRVFPHFDLRLVALGRGRSLGQGSGQPSGEHCAGQTD